MGQESLDDTLQRLSLYAFPSTIMKYSRTNKWGDYEYSHLTTGATVVVPKSSMKLWGNNQETNYITCASVRVDSQNSGLFYAAGTQPVTLTQLTDSDKYTSWIVRKDPVSQGLDSFDPESGTGKGRENYVFQDYVHETTRIIGSKLVAVDQQSHPEIVHKALQEYILKNIAQFDSNYENNLLLADRYAQLTNLASANELQISIPSKKQDLLNLHYTTKLQSLGTINNLQEFRDLLEQSNVSLKFEIEDYLTDQDYEIIDSLDNKYPNVIEGYAISYMVTGSRVVPYISEEKEKIYTIAKSRILEKASEELDLEIKCKYIGTNNLGSIDEVANNYADNDISAMKQAFIHGLGIPSFTSIENESDLDKLTAMKACEHPITGEPVMIYPYISTNSWDQSSIYWNTIPVDIKKDRNYSKLIDQINAKKLLLEIRSNFEQVKAEKAVQLDSVKVRLEKSNDAQRYDSLVSLYNKFANLQDNEITTKVIQMITSFDKEINDINSVQYYGEDAIKKVEDSLSQIKEMYPEGKEYEEGEILDSGYNTINIGTLKIDGKDCFHVNLVLNRSTRKYEVAHVSSNEFETFRQHPKCSEVKTESKEFANPEYWQIREKLIGEHNLREANRAVENGEWGYGSFTIDPDKKAKLYRRVIGQLSSSIDATQKYEIEKFITYNKLPVYADDKIVPIFNNQTRRYEKQLCIVMLSDKNNVNIDPKGVYYFNITSEENQVDVKNISPDSDVSVFFITGEVKLQPPFPIPSNLPTEEIATTPAASQEDLAALLGAFGKKPGSDKKKKR
jgi:hypothetical protein